MANPFSTLGGFLSDAFSGYTGNTRPPRPAAPYMDMTLGAGDAMGTGLYNAAFGFGQEMNAAPGSSKSPGSSGPQKSPMEIGPDHPLSALGFGSQKNAMGMSGHPTSRSQLINPASRPPVSPAPRPPLTPAPPPNHVSGNNMGAGMYANRSSAGVPGTPFAVRTQQVDQQSAVAPRSGDVPSVLGGGQSGPQSMSALASQLMAEPHPPSPMDAQLKQMAMAGQAGQLMQEPHAPSPMDAQLQQMMGGMPTQAAGPAGTPDQVEAGLIRRYQGFDRQRPQTFADTIDTPIELNSPWGAMVASTRNAADQSWMDHRREALGDLMTYRHGGDLRTQAQAVATTANAQMKQAHNEANPTAGLTTPMARGMMAAKLGVPPDSFEEMAQYPGMHNAPGWNELNKNPDATPDDYMAWEAIARRLNPENHSIGSAVSSKLMGRYSVDQLRKRMTPGWGLFDPWGTDAVRAHSLGQYLREKKLVP